MHFVVSIMTGDFSDLIFIVSYTIPGVVMCLLYEKTKNIFAPIILHLVNNLLAIIVMLTV